MGRRRRRPALPRLPRRRTRRSISGTATRGSSRPRTRSSIGSRSRVARSTTTSSTPFCHELADAVRQGLVLPMNTGAEGVESRDQDRAAVGLPRARVSRPTAPRSSCARTTSTAGRPRSSASRPIPTRATASVRSHRVSSPFPSATPTRCAAAITARTVAFLVEPVQGEAGVIVPPAGLSRGGARHLYRRGRADDRRRDPVGSRAHGPHVRVRPRVGACPTSTSSVRPWAAAIMPLSAVVADATDSRCADAGFARQHVRRQPAGVRSGTRGHRDAAHRRVPGAGRRASARNWRACSSRSSAAARAKCESTDCGPASTSPTLRFRRVRVCEMLLERGVLAKDAHEHTVRLAPPIVIDEHDLVGAVEQLADVLDHTRESVVGSMGGRSYA